jgi:hypothetical protein
MTRQALLAASLCVAGVLTSLAPAQATAADPFQSGFVFTGWKSSSYLTPRSDDTLRQAAATGSGHAAIFTQWFMDTPASSRLAPSPSRTPSDESISHAAAEARRSGMEVTLKPQIGIYTGSWIGGAHPADLDAFWADYRTMLLHYADLAREVGATTLVVGTEMGTLSWDEAHWRPLIAEVRERFGGALTYAANYDEFQRVPFWDALDYIGIDAYFALADAGRPDPSAAELAGAWSSRGYLDRIAAVSRRVGKRVLFTELGYRGTHTTALHPNVWNIVDTTDVQAQANAYQAFYTAVADRPWMAGVYWWEVNADDWWVQDYSPLGKPAAQIMTEWNRRATEVTEPPVVVEPPTVEPPTVEPPTVEPPPIDREPVDASPAAAIGPPAPAPATPPSTSSNFRPAIELALNGRRLAGVVRPYDRACGGELQLRVRRRQAGRWRYIAPPAGIAPGVNGHFTRRMSSGRLRVRAVFSSACGTARSGWVRTAR